MLLNLSLPEGMVSIVKEKLQRIALHSEILSLKKINYPVYTKHSQLVYAALALRTHHNPLYKEYISKFS